MQRSPGPAAVLFTVARNDIPCLDGAKFTRAFFLFQACFSCLLIQINIIIPHSNMIKALML
jgi:hypothetical protein